MQVLVTGGAGFIGSHLADALHARGDRVVVVDSLTTGRADRVPDVEFHKSDVTDAEQMAKLFARIRPEVVYHLAAQADVAESVAAPVADASVNLLGTVTLLQVALNTSARIVFASTSAVYATDGPLPAREDSSLSPGSPYGAAKLSAEIYLRQFNRLYGTRHAALRLANVYGPRQEPRAEGSVIATFASSVLDRPPKRPVVFGTGTQTRDFIYVGDVVRAFLLAGDATRDGVWNVGTGQERSLLDLLGNLGLVAGTTIEPRFAEARPGDAVRSCLAAQRAREDLGFTASTPLVDGLRQVRAWIAAGSPPRGHA
jgi:UDP-glucose 4-epimerase